MRKALARSKYDASDILAKIALYAVFLFVLQMAFVFFGPNPISELLFAVIAFLPNLFSAILIWQAGSAVRHQRTARSRARSCPADFDRASR